MAFSTVSIAIDEILPTDFYPDVATKSNANFQLLQDLLENLLNNFEIDITAVKIGESTPIASLTTSALIIQDGTFLFTQSSPALTLASLVKNGSGDSVFTVDHVVSVDDVSTVNVTSTGTTSTGNLEVSGNSTFALNTDFTVSQVNEYQAVTVPMVYNIGTGYGIGNLNLTSTSRKNIFLTLDVSGQLSIYNPGLVAWAAGLAGLQINISTDSTSPPLAGQEFKIFITNIVVGTNQIFQSWTTFANAFTKFITLLPSTAVGQNVAFGNNLPGAATTIKFSNNPFDSFIALYLTNLVDASGNNGGPTVFRFVTTADRNMLYV